MQLVIDLPPRQQQLELNRRRWEELLSDSALAALPYRIETNAYGHIIMNPPPAGRHSSRQGEITVLLHRFLSGRSLPECPVSTIDGVKACDVGWYSDHRFAAVRDQIAFETAPEICVEVLSPSNTESEMRLKRRLYFDAGAEEVWICGIDGTMVFYEAAQPDQPVSNSQRCPDFPSVISD